MSNIISVGDFKIIITVFLFNESFGDCFGHGGHTVGVGGFEAYDKWAGKWYPELLAVFDKYTGRK